MRIVQIANLYTPVSGGLRVAVEALGAGYVRAGHERVVIVPGRCAREERSDTGARLALRSVPVPGSGGYRILPSRPHVERRLASLLPEVLEVSDKLTMAGLGPWARRHGIPAVLISHERLDAILAERTPSASVLRRAADRWNRRLAASFDAIVCASDFAAEEFRRVGARNLRRVPLGVDLATFRPRAMPEQPDGFPVTIACVGRLSREKRPDLAIEVVRILHGRGMRVRLWLIGDGPWRQRLVRLSRGLPVEFLGHIPDRQVLRGLLARADVAIAACPYETFGLAALEALACGTPIVVPPRGALPELVVDDCGVVAARADPAALAQAVRDVLAQPVGATRLAARRRAEQFPWTATVDAMLALHHELLA